MLLTVLSVPDCPNVKVLLDRLDAALGDRPADLAVIVVDNDAHAQSWGMTGSPTLLVEGKDPFAAAGVATSVSCRLYRGADGTIGGAPSREHLQAVLDTTPSAGPPQTPTVPQALDRAGRGRRAPAEHGLLAVQQAVLRTIAESGNPPDPDQLDHLAARSGRRATEVLDDLAAQDYLSVETNGLLRAAYPFSIRPSSHRLHMPGGHHAWAMCAIDALGVAAMLAQPVLIDSSDPLTGELIHLRTDPHTATHAEPASTVVHLAGRRGPGPAADLCCDTVNFFTSPHSATRWATQHSDLPGQITDLQTATRLARDIFGELLRR